MVRNGRLQVTVTKGAFKKSGKLKSKSVIATILIFVFAFVSTVILIQMKKKTLVFEEHYFYFVCADSSKRVGILDNEKEYLKNIGGASVTHFYKENFYLVANVYLNLADAEEINAGLINNFPRSEVVTIKTEKVPKQAKNSIKNDVWLLNFVKFLYEYNKQFYLNSMDFYTGKQTESDFISSLVSKSLEFDEFKKNIEGDAEIYEVFKEYVGLFSLQLTSFLNNFYIAKNKQHYVSAYYVGFVINYLEFYDSLKIS